MPDELIWIFAVVLRDLDERSPRPTVEIRNPTGEPGDDCVVLKDPLDGTAYGMSVALSDPEPVRVAAAADQLQEWVIEALWHRGESTSWPECPAHPNSHPLTPVVTAEQAVWTCPKLGVVVADVGGLHLEQHG